MNKKTVGIIPARWQSSRFPGKPLADILGKPMIQWVYERASQSLELDGLYVATDDNRILERVLGFGGKAILTSKDAKSGTDRVCQASNHPEIIDAEIIINIQGDEPLIDSKLIDEVSRLLKNNPEIPIVTACAKLEKKLAHDPNIVKVVTGKTAQGNKNIKTALYFSRSLIPYQKNRLKSDVVYLRHFGIYGFQKKALEEFAGLPPSILEEIESLEQLRMLEAGWKIGIIVTDYKSIEVDAPGDIDKVIKRMALLS